MKNNTNPQAAQMQKPSNPFRERMMKMAFDDMTTAYVERRRVLFWEDGSRNMGNSAASMFWRGFDGVQIGVWDDASRRTFPYAQWKAGKACAEMAAREDVARGTPSE